MLPAVLLLPIAFAVGALVLGLLSMFFPALGGMLWGLIFLAAAYYIPDFLIYDSKKLKLGLKSILGMMGVFIISLSLFGISLSQFFTSAIAYSGAITTGSTVDAAGVNFFEETGLSLVSITNIALATITTFVLNFLFVEYVMKKNKRKRR